MLPVANKYIGKDWDDLVEFFKANSELGKTVLTKTNANDEGYFRVLSKYIDIELERADYHEVEGYTDRLRVFQALLDVQYIHLSVVYAFAYAGYSLDQVERLDKDSPRTAAWDITLTLVSFMETTSIRAENREELIANSFDTIVTMQQLLLACVGRLEKDKVWREYENTTQMVFDVLAALNDSIYFITTYSPDMEIEEEFGMETSVEEVWGLHEEAEPTDTTQTFITFIVGGSLYLGESTYKLAEGYSLTPYDESKPLGMTKRRKKSETAIPHYLVGESKDMVQNVGTLHSKTSAHTEAHQEAVLDNQIGVMALRRGQPVRVTTLATEMLEWTRRSNTVKKGGEVVFDSEEWITSQVEGILGLDEQLTPEQCEKLTDWELAQAGVISMADFLVGKRD